jgi:hypothetical protein
MNMEALVEKYVQVRDKKKEIEGTHKKQLAPYTEALTKLEAVILNHLNTTGSESVRTNKGTAYKSVSTSVTTADKGAFTQWCIDNQMWDMTDMRPAKKAVEDYVAEKDDLPPGLNWAQAVTVGVRRS